MALTIGSIARFSDVGTSPFEIISASFTAPAGSLLICAAHFNDNDFSAHGSGVHDSGELTWTLQAERASEETPGGGEASLWTAVAPTAVSRTVAIEWTGTANGAPRRISGKVYWVEPGWDTVNPLATITASNESGSTTNNYTTPALTPPSNGVLFLAASEWNTLGTIAAHSLDVADHLDYIGEFTVISGYKVVTNGVNVTVNLDAAGTFGANWKECRIIVREAIQTAVLSGTAVGGITEGDVVAGGKTIVITLSGTTFIT
jgi:hypothetical protein